MFGYLDDEGDWCEHCKQVQPLRDNCVCAVCGHGYDDIFDRTFGAWGDRPDHLEELHEASQARLQALYGDNKMICDICGFENTSGWVSLAEGKKAQVCYECYSKQDETTTNHPSYKIIRDVDAPRRLRDASMNSYQREASTTAHYPHEQGVVYTALGLAGEAGEIANKMKKVIRGDKSITECREDLASELGDVLWYVAMLAKELDYSLDDIAQLNLAKLKDRQARNTIKGDGDNR